MAAGCVHASCGSRLTHTAPPAPRTAIASHVCRPASACMRDGATTAIAPVPVVKIRAGGIQDSSDVRPHYCVLPPLVHQSQQRCLRSGRQGPYKELPQRHARPLGIEAVGRDVNVSDLQTGQQVGRTPCNAAQSMCLPHSRLGSRDGRPGLNWQTCIVEECWPTNAC